MFTYIKTSMLTFFEIKGLSSVPSYAKTFSLNTCWCQKINKDISFAGFRESAWSQVLQGAYW